MVRTYVKKTERGQYGNKNLEDELKAVNDRTSKEYGKPARTLRRHRDNKVQQPGKVALGRHLPALPSHVEKELHDHIQTMDQLKKAQDRFQRRKGP